LSEPPSIPHFHSAEAERLRGPWQGVTTEQRNAKIDSLIDVIGRCTRRAICSRMRRCYYDKLVKGKIPKEWDDPYYVLFTCIIGAAINIEKLGQGDKIDFVFDLDIERGSQCNVMAQALQAKSGWDSIVGVERKDDKEFKPLQAADLLAWQIRRFFSVAQPRRKHFDLARHAPPEEYHEFVVDKNRTQEFVTEMRQRDAKLSEPFGPI
jgi:hypothetical protein